MSVLPTVRRQVLEAAERQATPGRTGIGAPWRRRRVRIGSILMAALSAVAILVAVGALVLLGRHGSTSTPSPTTVSTSRQELLQTLGVLRAPPTAAARRAMECAKSRPSPPSRAFIACRRTSSVSVLAPFSSAPRQMLAISGYRKLDPPLIRVVAIPQFDASLTLAPATWQPSRHSPQRVEGLEVALGYSRGQTGSGPEGVATVSTHGMAVSDANATPKMTTVLGAVVVPDGVASVTLEPIRLISPPARLDPHRFGTVTAPVHDNVAAFQFPVPTATNRHTRSALYGVPVVARSIWHDKQGNVISRTTTRLYLSIRVRGKGAGGSRTIP
jgi:hypothetical protein